MNKVILIGRVGTEPIKRNLESWSTMLNGSISLASEISETT